MDKAWTERTTSSAVKPLKCMSVDQAVIAMENIILETDAPSFLANIFHDDYISAEDIAAWFNKAKRDSLNLWSYWNVIVNAWMNEINNGAKPTKADEVEALFV